MNFHMFLLHFVCNKICNMLNILGCHWSVPNHTLISVYVVYLENVVELSLKQVFIVIVLKSSLYCCIRFHQGDFPSLLVPVILLYNGFKESGNVNKGNLPNRDTENTKTQKRF